MQRETSIDIHFPELTDLISSYRAKTVAVAAKGVPPHITLLYPWVDASQINNHIERLKFTLKHISPFSIIFSSFNFFPNGTLFLQLADDKPIRNVMKAIRNAFPKILPYGGEFLDPAPHLTIAKTRTPEEALRMKKEIVTVIEPKLPITVDVNQVIVMQETESENWQNAEVIKLF